MVLDIIVLPLLPLSPDDDDDDGVLCVPSKRSTELKQENNIQKRNCLPKYTQETRSELNVRTYVDIHWQMAFCNLSLSIFYWSFHRFMFTFALCVVPENGDIYFHKNHWHHCYNGECISIASNMPYYITRKINVFGQRSIMEFGYIYAVPLL